MYARLRVAGPSPSVCLICTHLSRLRISRPPSERYYAAQAALAPRPPKPMSVEPGPSDQGSSTEVKVSRSKTASRSKKGDSKARAKRESRASRSALQAAEEAERERKALAIMGKTSEFAAAADTLRHEPTLADLEELRPKAPPISLKYIYPTRLHYAFPPDATIELHNTKLRALVDTLTQKFSRKQLLKMYKEGKRQRSGVQLGTPRTIGSLKTRQDVAGEIIRWLWEWPYITEVTQRRDYLTERSERVFPLGTSEFFLLLGPDGSSLLSLTESFKIVIKQVVRTEDSFSLVVEGLNYMLDRLSVVLTQRKKEILSEVVSVESKAHETMSCTGAKEIRPDLLQRISKLSDALVEDKGDGKFRISARHLRNIESATRLTTRASQQVLLPPPPLLVHLPTTKDTMPGMMFPHNYALFPFELPTAASLPWNWISTGTLSSSSGRRQSESEPVATSSGTPFLFRARKVSDWLGQAVNDKASHLRDGVGRLLSSTGRPHTLHDTLGLEIPDVTPDTGRRKKIVASTGYVAFSSAVGIRNTLLPPLPGSWTFPHLLEWMKTDKGKITFIPSPPQPLAKSSLSEQPFINHLVYRSLASNPPPNKEQRASAETVKTIKIEISLNTEVQDQNHLDPEGSDAKPDGEATSDSVRLLYDDPIPQETQTPMSEDQFRISSGVESFVNLMLPDRPIDIQLSLFDFAPVLPDSIQPELRQYAFKLAQHFGSAATADVASCPDPPLYMTYEGNRYFLDSNAMVRRSSNNIAEIEYPTYVLTENVVDQESKQQTTACQAICTEQRAVQQWQKFLEDCDRLTWLTEKEKATSTILTGDGTIDNQEIY